MPNADPKPFQECPLCHEEAVKPNHVAMPRADGTPPPRSIERVNHPQKDGETGKIKPIKLDRMIEWKCPHCDEWFGKPHDAAT